MGEKRFTRQSLLSPLLAKSMPRPSGVAGKVASSPPGSERMPLSNPRKSVALVRPWANEVKWVWSLTEPPMAMRALFSLGTSFVSIKMKPPEKSAG